MPIYVGSTEITEIQLGGISNAPFESVYIGADKVFRRPRLYDVTVGFRSIASGTDGYGYSSLNSNGSISNPQPVPSSSWFNGYTTTVLEWEDYFNTSTGRFYFRVSNDGLLNTDNAFKTLKVNNTVLNREDADGYVNSGAGNFTLWYWDLNTNPWSGTGNTDRVRFDKP